MPEFNTRKVAFQVNAPNKEEAMKIEEKINMIVFLSR